MSLLVKNIYFKHYIDQNNCYYFILYLISKLYHFNKYNKANKVNINNRIASLVWFYKPSWYQPLVYGYNKVGWTITSCKQYSNLNINVIISFYNQVASLIVIKMVIFFYERITAYLVGEVMRRPRYDLYKITLYLSL